VRPLVLVAVLSASACSPEALASLTPAEDDAPLTELSHDVEVHFAGAGAQLVVERTFRNDGPAYATHARGVALPEGATATGLRLRVDGAWRRATSLLDVAALDERWDLLRALGDATPEQMARLHWEGGVVLELANIAPGQTVTVEYVLEVDRPYALGERRFEYEADDVTPVFHFAAAPGARLLREEAKFVVAEDWSPSESASLRWATFPLGFDRELWRVELDVAASLGELPTRANLVVVVDASHSQGPDGIAGQLALLEPLLAKVPDAQVELVFARRSATRLFGRFVDASDVMIELARIPPERLAPGNGSNLDEGLLAAAATLAGKTGPARLIAFTDGDLASGLTSDRTREALAGLPGEVVAHVVIRERVTYGAPELHRADDVPFADVANLHGGIGAALTGLGDAGPALEGLLRPTRIDALSLEAEGLADELFEVEGSLAEGSAVRLMDVRAAKPTALLMRGKIWARPWERRVVLDDALAQRLPGLAAGSDVRNSLQDEELRTVAFSAHAVSSVTGFLDAPDDAAPSFAGLTEFGRSGSGIELNGRGGSMTTCRMGVSRVKPGLREALLALLQGEVTACKAQHGALPVALRLEATRDEVVDVTVDSASTALGACVTEAAWAVRLPMEFDAPHASWNVAF
jgi:hypothetical protein